MSGASDAGVFLIGTFSIFACAAAPIADSSKAATTRTTDRNCMEPPPPDRGRCRKSGKMPPPPGIGGGRCKLRDDVVGQSVRLEDALETLAGVANPLATQNRRAQRLASALP